MVRSSYFVPQILRRLDYSEIEYLRIQSDNIFIEFNNSEDIKIICRTSREGEYPQLLGDVHFICQRVNFGVFLWAKACAFLAKTVAPHGQFFFYWGGVGRTNIYMII